jgi:hypothetical protein
MTLDKWFSTAGYSTGILVLVVRTCRAYLTFLASKTQHIKKSFEKFHILVELYSRRLPPLAKKVVRYQRDWFL